MKDKELTQAEAFTQFAARMEERYRSLLTAFNGLCYHLNHPMTADPYPPVASKPSKASSRAGRRATAGAMISNYRAKYAIELGRQCNLHDDVIFAIIDGAPVLPTTEEHDNNVVSVMKRVDTAFAAEDIETRS